MNYVGVDWCKRGWFAVFRGPKKEFLCFPPVPDIQNLAEMFPSASRIFIDIPIGLPWQKVKSKRDCDVVARKLLKKPRSNSVFTVPCRKALESQNFYEACRINRSVLNHGLTKQAWNICDKIRKVDKFLRNNPHEQKRFQEIHPELCFWALNDKHPMKYKKTIEKGIKERRNVLCRYEPKINYFLKKVLADPITKSSKLQRHDVLDAIVALITAEAHAGKLVSIPGNLREDQCGLKMNMVYLDLEAKSAR